MADFMRYLAYIAVLPICAGISYATDDHVAWFMTELYGVGIAFALPLLVWARYFRFRDGALRGD